MTSHPLVYLPEDAGAAIDLLDSSGQTIGQRAIVSIDNTCASSTTTTSSSSSVISTSTPTSTSTSTSTSKSTSSTTTTVTSIISSRSTLPSTSSTAVFSPTSTPVRSQQGMSTGGKIGGAVGGILALVILLVLLAFCYKRRARKAKDEDTTPDMHQIESQQGRLGVHYSAVPVHDRAPSVLSTPMSDVATSIKTPGSAYSPSSYSPSAFSPSVGGGGGYNWVASAAGRQQRPFSMAEDSRSRVTSGSDQDIEQRQQMSQASYSVGEVVRPYQSPSQASGRVMSSVPATIPERHIVDHFDGTLVSATDAMAGNNPLHQGSARTGDLVLNASTSARAPEGLAPAHTINPLLQSSHKSHNYHVSPPALHQPQQARQWVQEASPSPAMNEDIVAHSNATPPSNPLLS
ncbi:hypothetical protein OC845_005622 [Tilletia horrida]|nr:hypothetical protein OC845_005622 [Tilletia horrida]